MRIGNEVLTCINKPAFVTQMQYNCCKTTDFSAQGCMSGAHSDQVDDSDMRGYSKDPRSAEDVQRLEARRPSTLSDK
jgi:hypothetical protein